MDVRFPIGPLQVPAEVNRTHIAQWVAQIETYVTRLRNTVEGISEAEWQATYREGAWNVRQLVHHIADSQLNMYQRLKLALTDDNPTVPAFDEERWAVLPDTELPVESSLAMLDGINTRVVALANTLTDEQLKRTFTHETNGAISVATKVAKLCWHEEHHLAHIEIALNKRA